MKPTILILTMTALLGAGASAYGAPSDEFAIDHDCACIDEGTMKIAETRIDHALTCRQTTVDFYAVEGELFERLQHASIEGSGKDMLDFADAIEQRKTTFADRVALVWDGHDGLIWSPRNSLVQTRVRVDRLDELVPILRSAVAAPYRDESMGPLTDLLDEPDPQA